MSNQTLRKPIRKAVFPVAGLGTLCNLAYNFNRLIFHERRESMG